MLRWSEDIMEDNGWLELMECERKLSSDKYVSKLLKELLPISSCGEMIKEEYFMEDGDPF